MDFTVLSLCAGYGGIDLGIGLTVPGARSICFVEREIAVCRILAARMEDGSLDRAPIWTDLKTFDGKPWRRRVHCITAGYPCQPFSHAGKRKGTKDERHLWPHVRRIIEQVEPLIVFLENVDGHLSLGFREVSNDLRRLGYEGEAGIFSAAEVGASHLRKRLFCLAYRASGGLGVLRESSGIDGLANGRDAELADAGDGLVPITGRGSQGRSGPGSTSAALENARLLCTTGRISYAGKQKSGRALAKPSRSGGILADAQRTSSTARKELHEVGRPLQTVRFNDGGIPLFAPGPDDIEEWRRILAIDPTLEPAVCRAADGTTSRVDQLRALGNGVVPLVAAHAFRSLTRTILANNNLIAERRAA